MKLSLVAGSLHFSGYARPPRVPYLTEEEKASGMGGKAVISCLFPEQIRGEMRASIVSFETSYPEEIKRKVLANWSGYGFA